MALTDEEVADSIKECVDAWSRAKGIAVEIQDIAARAAYEKVAAHLLDESLRECLAPLFRGALKRAEKNRKKKNKQAA